MLRLRSGSPEAEGNSVDTSRLSEPASKAAEDVRFKAGRFLLDSSAVNHANSDWIVEQRPHHHSPLATLSASWLSSKAWPKSSSSRIVPRSEGDVPMPVASGNCARGSSSEDKSSNSLENKLSDAKDLPVERPAARRPDRPRGSARAGGSVSDFAFLRVTCVVTGPAASVST
jgi:hypothetical protein